MNWQDRDLKKIKQLIKSFGLKLYFQKYSRYTDMAHYVAGSHITIFVHSKTNKKEVILSLLHELGHHIDWITNKRLDKETEKAYSGFDAKDFKKYTKIILDVEKAGVKHMSSIHKLLDLEIPLELVKQQEKIDLFHYKFFYENRRYPKDQEVMAFKKRLKYGKRKKRRISKY